MKNIVRGVIRYFPFIFLILSFAFLLYCLSIDRSGVITTDDLLFIENWTVIDSTGNSTEVGRSYVDERAYNEDFVITATLPGGIKDNSYLCFATRSDTIVYVNGVIRKEFIRKQDVDIPGGSVKGFYFTVPLYESDSNADLRIFRGRTDRHPEVAPLAFVSTMSGVYSYLIGEYGVTFFLALALLLLSVIVIAASLVMRAVFKRQIDLLYAALGIFVTSLWILTNSYLCPFMIGHYHIDGIMNYLSCLLLPMGFLLYLDSIQKGRYTRYLTALMIVDIVSSVIWTFLHFAHIFPFDKALAYIDMILAVIMLCVFIMLFADLKKGHFREYIYTAIGFLGFIFMGVTEVIVLLFVETKHDSIPMLFGLDVFFACVILQQISDLVRINRDKKKALELSDAKTRFLAGMSHEIRTPINSILGMNEMILSESKDPTIDRYAKSVRSSGKMLLTLVNDVLDFSKIEAGGLDINPADYSLTRLILDIMPMINERASAKGLDYENIIEEDVPDGQHSDEFRIKQVLLNLISNAIKYTDEGEVRLRVGGEYISDKEYILKLSVCDTGRGIREEDKGALFDAFARVDMKKNRNIEGTGLGLAIVKNIIDSMGGEISVESEYGKGSVFSVAIPVGVTDRKCVNKNLSVMDAAVEEKTEAEYTAPDAKVLAVDDNETNLMIVKFFLKHVDIEPDICGNGNSALEKCRETQYDLILLDHMMPDPDGMETLELIRKDERSLNADTPAVILTANAMAGSRQMYMEAGFADYLTKPIDSTVLEHTVRKYLPDDKIKPSAP